MTYATICHKLIKTALRIRDKAVVLSMRMAWWSLQKGIFYFREPQEWD